MSRTDGDLLWQWERLWLDPDWDPVQGYRGDPVREPEQAQEERET